jgi:hypothetical protein
MVKVNGGVDAVSALRHQSSKFANTRGAARAFWMNKHQERVSIFGRVDVGVLYWDRIDIARTV